VPRTVVVSQLGAGRTDRDGYRVPVPDLAIQPLELDVLAGFVLDVATDTRDGRLHGEILELAGPREGDDDWAIRPVLSGLA
jgi:hypothetical protein